MEPRKPVIEMINDIDVFAARPSWSLEDTVNLLATFKAKKQQLPPQEESEVFQKHWHTYDRILRDVLECFEREERTFLKYWDGITSSDLTYDCFEKCTVFPGKLLNWAEAVEIYVPADFAKKVIKMEKARERLPSVKRKQSDPPRLRNSQRRRERCRAIADLLWSSNPDITIADMVVRDEITSFGCEGQLYCEEVLRTWINDLAPDRKPGRRKTKA